MRVAVSSLLVWTLSKPVIHECIGVRRGLLLLILLVWEKVHDHNSFGVHDYLITKY